MLKPSDITVMIMAAGVGSRLKPLTDTTPKVMAPMADGRPLLEHTLLLLRDQGFKTFIINVHHLADQIESYFGDGSKLGITISYSDERSQLLEVGGAIKKAAGALSEPFVLFYGDHVHRFDVRPLLQAYEDSKTDGVIVLKPAGKNPQSGDLVQIASRSPGSPREAETMSSLPVASQATARLIKQWIPRPHNITTDDGTYFKNTGIDIFSKKILEYIPAGKPISLDREVLPTLVNEKKIALYGYLSTEPILDMGTPEKYTAAKLWHGETLKKALFLDRDGVICLAPPRLEYIMKPEQFTLLPGITELIKVAKEKGYEIIVATNQPQIGRGLMPAKDLEPIHQKMNSLLPGLIDAIYVCAHQNTDNCDCRKPKPGLLLRAARERGIALNRSLFLGDSDKDVGAGTAASVKTVFLKNSQNSEELARCKPDLVIASLADLAGNL